MFVFVTKHLGSSGYIHLIYMYRDSNALYVLSYMYPADDLSQACDDDINFRVVCSPWWMLYSIIPYA